MYNKILLAFDNIIYNHTVRKNEDLEIILPRRAPAKTKVHSSAVTKEHIVIMSPATQVRVKLFLIIKDYVPKLDIHSEDGKSKVNYANNIELEANSTCLLTFTSLDGGITWLIGSLNYGGSGVQPSPNVESVNGIVGPNIIITANDIKLNKSEQAPTIVQQFRSLDNKINEVEITLKNDVGEVVRNLPTMIELQIKDTTIIAEKV